MLPSNHPALLDCPQVRKADGEQDLVEGWEYDRETDCYNVSGEERFSFEGLVYRKLLPYQRRKSILCAVDLWAIHTKTQMSLS